MLIPYEKWITFALLVTFSFLSVLLINQRLEETEPLILISDETTNYRVLQSIEKFGTPYERIIDDNAIYDEDYKNKTLYFNYAVELYLRYPFFLSRHYFPERWVSASNLFYFYFLLGLLLVYAAFKNNQGIPVLALGFFILFLGLSSWTSSSFHYLRYYAFVMMSVAACHFLAMKVFLSKDSSSLKRYVNVTLITFVPVLFHMSNVIYWGMWGILILADALRFNFESIKLASKSAKFFLGVLAGCLLIIATLVLTYNRWHINLTFDLLPIWGKFVELNMGTNAISLLTVSIVSIGGLLSLSVLPSVHRYMVVLSLFFFLIGLLILSLAMGGSYVEYYGYNRYMFSLHVYYLIAFSLLAYAFSRGIASLFGGYSRPVAWGLVPLLIAGIFVFELARMHSVEKDNFNFSLIPRITKDELEQMKTAVGEKDVAVFSGDAGLLWHFRDKPGFLLRSYPNRFDGKKDGYSEEMSGNKLVMHKGLVFSDSYIRVKDDTSFCKALNNYPSEYVSFAGIGRSLREVEESIGRKLADIYARSRKSYFIVMYRNTVKEMFCKKV